MKVESNMYCLLTVFPSHVLLADKFYSSVLFETCRVAGQDVVKGKERRVNKLNGNK